MARLPAKERDAFIRHHRRAHHLAGKARFEIVHQCFKCFPCEIGHGHGRHAMTDGGFHQIVRADDAIRQGKLGVDSEMNERPGHGRYLTVNPMAREAEKTSAAKDSKAY